MAHLNGLLLVDAPASALNNAGEIPGERVDNKTAVKFIRTRGGAYPYVSAQAFRYWLRTSLEESDLGWQSAPVYRERKVGYTDANPILYWDDDLFGYMRVPSKDPEAVEAREADASHASRKRQECESRFAAQGEHPRIFVPHDANRRLWRDGAPR